MPKQAKAIVLDSWSVIAYFDDEPAGEQVASMIADAHQSETPLMMAVVNVGEVWYLIARETSEAEAEQSIAELRQLRIEFVDADWRLTREAAALKAKHRLSFADGYAAALAKERKAQLVTGDQEFKQLEGEIQVIWL